ncbi:MAG TPA: VOC family protein [Caulobacterales bacterium]|nr:VOC family protein [Caulobacterales bacterium]
MARVVHFEIHAGDPERAARFYQEAFGWTFQHIPQLDYWLIGTGEGEGINGGLLRRRGPAPTLGQPVNAFVCTLGVDDFDAAFAAAIKAGASIAMPKTPIPNVGYVGYLHDLEGNIFGVHQADPNAA